mgnify:CR=1 FL=1
MTYQEQLVQYRDTLVSQLEEVTKHIDGGAKVAAQAARIRKRSTELGHQGKALRAASIEHFRK